MHEYGNRGGLGLPELIDVSMANRTKIDVLIEDIRIKKYLCERSPITQTTHIVGLYHTVLVALLTDALYTPDLRVEFSDPQRYEQDCLQSLMGKNSYMCFGTK